MVAGPTVAGATAEWEAAAATAAEGKGSVGNGGEGHAMGCAKTAHPCKDTKAVTLIRQWRGRRRQRR